MCCPHSKAIQIWFKSFGQKMEEKKLVSSKNLNPVDINVTMKTDYSTTVCQNVDLDPSLSQHFVVYWWFAENQFGHTISWDVFDEYQKECIFQINLVYLQINRTYVLYSRDWCLHVQNAIWKTFDNPFSNIHVSSIDTNILTLVSFLFSPTFLISIVSQTK